MRRVSTSINNPHQLASRGSVHRPEVLEAEGKTLTIAWLQLPTCKKVTQLSWIAWDHQDRHNSKKPYEEEEWNLDAHRFDLSDNPEPRIVIDFALSVKRPKEEVIMEEYPPNPCVTPIDPEGLHDMTSQTSCTILNPSCIKFVFGFRPTLVILRYP
ncbi:hypothetical protein BOTCAL_0541g00060 [Botryotinia calthae]|uniref:Uncharacterized protein n=1 Tax=Botryotinia calthae TaxID=38488 RepID=A0A4Y8CKB5_9HELO|nr:hypothetical protein BOTCAL_0541g00060 [Botryotinia calthae]